MVLDLDRTLDFDGLSIENIRPVSPLPHRVDGGLDQNRMALQGNNISDPPCPVNPDLQHYIAADVGDSGHLRILRSRFIDGQTLDYAGTYVDPLS